MVGGEARKPSPQPHRSCSSSAGSAHAVAPRSASPSRRTNALSTSPVSANGGDGSNPRCKVPSPKRSKGLGVAVQREFGSSARVAELGSDRVHVFLKICAGQVIEALRS
eukprot:6190439-Pleurochrysis_carterae.AAC.3